jgi:hypothetical protein
MSPHPPYSPDLDPTDFYNVWSPEDPLLGRNFRSVEEVNVAVCVWLAQQSNVAVCVWLTQRPKSSSVEEFMSWWKVRRSVQNVVWTALKINVAVLQLFLL